MNTRAFELSRRARLRALRAFVMTISWAELPPEAREILPDQLGGWYGVEAPVERPIPVWVAPTEALVAESNLIPDEEDEFRDDAYIRALASHMRACLPDPADRESPVAIVEGLCARGESGFVRLAPVWTSEGALVDGRFRARAAQMAGLAYLPVVELSRWVGVRDQRFVTGRFRAPSAGWRAQRV